VRPGGAQQHYIEIFPLKDIFRLCLKGGLKNSLIFREHPLDEAAAKEIIGMND
jgi:hypothetical protein